MSSCHLPCLLHSMEGKFEQIITKLRVAIKGNILISTCKARFIDFHSVFTTNFRMVSLPHKHFKFTEIVLWYFHSAWVTCDSIRFAAILQKKLHVFVAPFTIPLCIGQIEVSTCPPPPRATPGHLTFLKIIVQIPPYPGQNTVQMPHTRVHSGYQMPPPRGHFTGTKMTEGRKHLQLSNEIIYKCNKN